MTLLEKPEEAPSADAYLMRCLRALRKGRPVPPRPWQLDGEADALERDVRRLEEVVAEEKRARARVKLERAGRAGLPFDALEVPGYAIESEIAPGSFGTVYRAVDRHVRGRKVALKVVRKPVRDSNLDDHRWEQTFGEAKKAAILNHPNIVKCLDHGFARMGPFERRAFFAMELVDGESFQSLLKREHAALPPGPEAASRRGADWRKFQRRVAETLIPIAQASHAAHVGRPNHGLRATVHSDIKPANILIDAEGVPYLTDFGLAIDPENPGSRGGTRGYMAPEMLDLAAPVGPPADIYSLGATLHDALVGTPPDAPQPGKPSARIPWVDRDLDAIRVKCLRFEPEQRYRTAAALAVDLRKFLNGEPVNARPVPWFTRFAKACWRHPRRVAAAVIAAAVVGLLASLWVQSLRQSQQIARLIGAMTFTLPLVDLVDSDSQAGSGDMDPGVRRRMVEGLLPYFDQVSDVQDDAGPVRLARAQAHLARARMRHALASPDDEKAALADAETASDLLSDLPKTAECLIARARTALVRSAILGPQQDYAAVAAEITPLIADLDAALRQNPDDGEMRFRLARLLNNRANCRGGQAKNSPPGGPRAAATFLDQAEADYVQAVEQLEILVRNAPGEVRYLEWLSRVEGNLGLVLMERAAARGPEGVAATDRAFTRAVAHADEVSRLVPNSLTARDALAASVVNLATGLFALKRPALAEAPALRAISLYDELNNQYPRMREFVWSQALARKTLGFILLDENKPAEAAPVLNDARDRYDRLIEIYKGVEDIVKERADLIDHIEKMGR